MANASFAPDLHSGSGRHFPGIWKKGQSRSWELCEAGAEPTPIPAWMGASRKMSWERLGFSQTPRPAAPDLIRLPRIVCPLPHASNR